jgi:uroporphyrinogen-III synthase
MRVIVTRPAAEAAEWVMGLREAGFDAVALPLIEILPAPEPHTLQDAWARLDKYRAVMFVSANAVRGFFAAQPAQAPFVPRAWSTGAGTKDALLSARVHPDRIDSPRDDAQRFDSEALWEIVHAQVGAGSRVLLVRGAEEGSSVASGRDWLAQRLVEHGVQAQTVVAYVRAAPRIDAQQLEMVTRAASDGSVWLFSSSHAIGNLRSVAPSVGWSRARAIATRALLLCACHARPWMR